jgi:hypothetical protein
MDKEIMGALLVLLVMCAPGWIVFSVVAVVSACRLSSWWSQRGK